MCFLRFFEMTCQKTVENVIKDQDRSLQDQDQDQFLFVWDRSCHKTEVSGHITGLINT